MKLIKTYLKTSESYNIEKNTVVCIGFFDGVHKLHKKILEKTKEIAIEKDLNSIVISFDKKISDFFNKTSSNFESNDVKRNKIKNILNPDYYVEIQVNEEVVSTSKEEFVNFLKHVLKVKFIVVGSDFRFGYKAEGDVSFLISNFGVDNVNVFERVEGISTTLLKEAKNNNDIEKIKFILGE